MIKIKKDDDIYILIINKKNKLVFVVNSSLCLELVWSSLAWKRFKLTTKSSWISTFVWVVGSSKFKPMFFDAVEE